MLRASLLALTVALAACSPSPPKAAVPAQSASVQAPAAAPVAANSEVFLTPDGVAVSGYDAVSFFEKNPQKGDPAIFSDHNGARYLFATAAHKAAFDAAPAKYEPQYGGYCAFGAAAGHKASTKPETGQVINGKLYFNYNTDVQKKFDADHAGYLSKADANWQRIKGDKPVG